MGSPFFFKKMLGSPDAEGWESLPYRVYLDAAVVAKFVHTTTDTFCGHIPHSRRGRPSAATSTAKRKLGQGRFEPFDVQLLI